MKQLKLIVFFTLAFLMGCGPKIKNDASIGTIEKKTYQSLVDRLTEDLKQKFGGNMYQNEKITAIETKDGIRIGIPNGTTYTFMKDNSKFIKGELNNDKLSDLVIWANFTEGRREGVKKYFLFLQKGDAYEYVGDCNADAMVAENCRKARLLTGVFNLDSIAGGLLVGNTIYQGNHEAYYTDYSYRCDTEKYKLDTATKKLDLVYQSDLLKKNDTTDVYEKVMIR